MSKRPVRPHSGIPRPKPQAHKRLSQPKEFLNNLDAVFKKQEEKSSIFTSDKVSHAHKTGQLNLSSKGLTTVPPEVWKLNEMDEEKLRRLDQSFAKDADEQTDEDMRWWEWNSLYELNICNNLLKTLPADIVILRDSLTVLKLHDNKLVSLPPEIGQLQRLTDLDVSQNELTDIPEELGSLCELRKLDVSKNQLKKLPLGIGFLSSLGVLDASHNQLSELPPEAAGLLGLVELRINHNQISELPSMGDLYRLQVLQASFNQITDWPRIEGCRALRELQLENNSIKEIPDEAFDTLGHLKTLKLRNNQIREVPETLARLQSLERLDLCNNKLEEVPAAVTQLPQLQLLLLLDNPFKSLRPDLLRSGTARILQHLRATAAPPAAAAALSAAAAADAENAQIPEISTIRNSGALSLGMRGLRAVPEAAFKSGAECGVERVDLCRNFLTALPVALPLLSETLTELDLSDNKLAELDGGIISVLKRLRFLNLHRNQLNRLPQQMATLHCLRELDISSNRFESIPSVIYELPGLEILSVRDNRLLSVDADGLARLPRIAVLHLANNSISNVPPELGLLRLTTLSLEGNPFRIPRPDVLAKGTDVVMRYLRDRIPGLSPTAATAAAAVSEKPPGGVRAFSLVI